MYSYDGHFNKSKVLSWNSRWCSPIGLTQSDIMTSLSHGTADWFFCIISQWACCSVFKNLTSACCSSCSMLQKSSSIPSSTCIDLLRGVWCKLYVGVISCYKCSICGCSKALQQQICSAQTKHMNIFLYPPRVVMIEISFTVYDHLNSEWHIVLSLMKKEAYLSILFKVIMDFFFFICLSVNWMYLNENVL